MDIGSQSVEVRPIENNEWEDAMGLAWRTFLKFEGDVYSSEGIQNFRDFITDQTLRRMFLTGKYKVYGAFYRGQLIGVASLRDKEHVSLLFVDENYHKNGIGRKLLETLKDFEKSIGGYRLTVHSSPYAVGFYHKVGFVDTNLQQLKDGISFTPMSWIF